MKQQILKSYIHLNKALGLTLVHFIHIGKTAGSAIKATVKERSIISGNLIRSNGNLFIMHGHSFRFQDVPDGEWAFFVVRDPIQRFISGFYSRKRMGRPKNNNPWSEREKKSFQLFDTPNQLGLSLGGDVEEVKNAEFALQNIGHVNSSYWDWFKDEKYFLQNKEKVLFVLEQENLNHDFNMFKQRFSPAIGNLPKDKIKSHKSPVGLNTILSSEAKNNLKDWYSSEYDFLDLLYNLEIIRHKYK